MVHSSLLPSAKKFLHVRSEHAQSAPCLTHAVALLPTGRHERPHTDHHMWRSPAASGSPTVQQAAAATTTANTTPGEGPPGPQTATAQQQRQPGAGWSWGFGGPLSSSSETEVYHSPPSGPGFLLQQQKRND